jgi:hypothetical protein
MIGTGFQTALVVGEENAYGVGAASSTPNVTKMPIVKPGIKGDQNLITSKVLLNDPNPRKPGSGNRTVTGTVELEASPKSFGWWLKWALGAPTSTAVGSGTLYVITASHTAGTKILAVSVGSGTLPVNTWVNIVHTDGTTAAYRINSSTGAPVTTVTIDGGLLSATSAGATITPIASSYGHAFNLLGANVPPPLFMEVQHADLNTFHLFKGVYLDKLSLKFAAEGDMTYSAMIEGKNWSLAGATAVTGTTTDPGHSPYAYFGATIFENDVLLGYVKELNIDIDRQRDKSQFVIDGTGTRYDIPAGIAKVSGTIKVLYTDDALMTKANAGTTTSIRAFCRDASQSAALQLFLPEVRLQNATEEVVSEAISEVTFPFEAFYSSNADATAIQATLLNAQASYASM